MKSIRNIVFLGMMGSGKSSIGKVVSKKLKIFFFDIDKHIEKNLKMEIAEIFKNKGENFFRKYEKKITLQILKKKHIIIALGGGAFLNKDVRQEILSKHTSFWLDCDEKIIIQRIINNPRRPLAYGMSEDEIIKLCKKRSKIYAKADFRINCSNLTKTQIVNKILNIYETNKIKN